jgi:hypothetical protein
VQREVRDRDYFYLWSFSAWSVWAALGLTYVWESLAAVFGHEKVRLGTDTFELPTRRGWMMGAPVLLLAFVPLFANWQAATRSGQTDTADFAIDLLNSVEPYGVLVTVGDNDTFPLWYAQDVLGVRKDVLIANTSLLNTDWYTRQMIRRPVFEYDAAKGPSTYRGKTWKKPAGPALKMTMDEADAVPLGQEVSQPQLFVAGNIKAIVQPRFLARADIFVLRLIQDGVRPVYFSRTSGSYGQELGLGGYLLTQGLARKLMPDSVVASRDTVRVPGEGFVDVSRTADLWKEFRAPASLIRKNDWVDRPSVGIPYLYVSTGVVLSESLGQRGDSAGAQAALGKAREVARATRLEDLFGPEAPPPPPVISGDSARKTTVPVRKRP